MGKLVVSQFVTVDGVIDSPGGGSEFERAGWSFEFDRGAEGNQFKLDELWAADAQLLGRVTYDEFAASWPERTDEIGFAEKMNSMPKYVVSTTLAEPAWANTTVLSDVAAVAGIKERHQGDIVVYGSATLLGALAEHGLVDEYRLMVFPVVLGAGKKLFGDLAQSARLRLVSTQAVGPDGVVILTYQPA